MVVSDTNLSTPSIVVTASDLERLQRVISAQGGETADMLDAELERAEVIEPDQVSRDVVIMNSDVVYEDTTTGARRTVRVVYPEDADPNKGWVSVLAPLGSALLGLRVGQEIDWHMPRGMRRLRIVDVPHQPNRDD